MADVSNELIVELLRRIQADTADMKLDLRESRTRMGLIERQVAEVSVRMDRRDEMTDRILRRLELADQPA